VAAQLSPLSLEDFHKLYDGAKPAYEYWHGAAIRKPMPTVLHGMIQILISMLLEKAGWNTASEVRLKVSSDAEPVPDVIAVRDQFTSLYPTSAPRLCVEVLSPSDTLAKALEKASRYILWGTKCVWIIDPEKRTAWSLSPEPEWISPTGTLRIDDTAIELTTLFAAVDKKLKLEDEPSR
jgi:Uma2 family endonuclease